MEENITNSETEQVQNATAPVAEERPAAPARKNKKSKWPLITVIAVVVAALLACAYFFVFGAKGKNEMKLIPIQQGDNWGYIDAKGQFVVNPQFEDAYPFSDGLALVGTKIKGKEGKKLELRDTACRTDLAFTDFGEYIATRDRVAYGFIDEKGNFKIQATYTSATSFSEGIAWVTTDAGAPTAINTKGNSLFTLTDAESVRNFSNGLAAFSKKFESKEDGTKILWGFVDKKGQVVINPTFHAVGTFSNGLCAVKNADDKWGYIDTKGKLAINYQFDRAGDYTGSTGAVVCSNDKWGVIDGKGKYIITPQFDGMRVDGDLYIIAMNDKFGWCDKKGKMVINPQFEAIGDCDDFGWGFAGSSLAPVYVGDKWGYVDKKGSFVINPQFDNASSFCGKLAFFYNGSDWGAIDAKGNYVINPQFKRVCFEYRSSLHSQYVDMAKIKAAFDITKLVPGTKTFGQLMEEYQLTQNSFSRYKDEQELKTEYFNGCKLEIAANGKPYRTEQRYNGWWTDTEYIFNSDIKEKGYQVSFEANASLYNLAKDVRNSINVPSDYKFICFMRTSEGEIKVYANQKTMVMMVINSPEGVGVMTGISDEDMATIEKTFDQLCEMAKSGNNSSHTFSWDDYDEDDWEEAVAEAVAE